MAPDLVKLDPDGDAILVVEGPQGAEVKFLISSKVLGLASPVFVKLFGPHFYEGMRMRESNCPELVIRDDDATAMRIILQALRLLPPLTDRWPTTTPQITRLSFYRQKRDAERQKSDRSRLKMKADRRKRDESRKKRGESRQKTKEVERRSAPDRLLSWNSCAFLTNCSLDR